MHLFKKDDQYILFNTSNLEFYFLSDDLGDKLSLYSEKDIVDAIGSDNENDNEIIEEVNTKRCKRVVFTVSQDCNLACKYCYAQEGTYGETNNPFMTLDTYQKAIKLMVEKFPKGIDTINFFGGEPLLNFKLIKQACEWTTRYFNKNSIKLPLYTIVTNGTIMNKAIIDFFNQYNFNVTISLDGNKEVNDSYRIFKYSKESVYEKVVKNINSMNKHRRFMLTIEITVTEKNIEQYVFNNNKLIDIESIHLLKPDYLHIVPVVDVNHCNHHQCKNTYTESLKDYFDSVTKYSLNSLLTINPIGIVKVADMASNLMKKKKRAHFCGAGMYDFSIDVNGDIYPCFTLIGVEEFKMGSIDDTANFEAKRQVFVDNTYDTVEECRSCWANGICSNCIGNGYLTTGSISKPIKDFCSIQKVMLERIMIEMKKYQTEERLA